jgi:hypothetical protein
MWLNLTLGTAFFTIMNIIIIAFKHDNTVGNNSYGIIIAVITAICQVKDLACGFYS